MGYHIEKKNAQSAYLQLYEQLRADIVSGAYAYGSKLPSKRQLAEDTGTSIVTVEHAYGILSDEGYIDSRQRSGYYVNYRAGDCFPGAAAEPREGRELRASENEFPFTVLARTMRRVLSDYGEALLVKSPNNGCAELRQAVADYLARSRGIRVRPAQIVVGSGAEYLYSLIVQLLGRERIYAVEEPSYEKIRRVYQANGVECDPLRLGADGVRTDELRRTAASVLHVTPFHSFPSGVTASAGKRVEYIRWAKERGGFIVEDDFDSEFSLSSKAEDTVFSLEPERSVIYINTFSKTVAPSLRVGYMVLPPVLLDQFERMVGFYSCTVPLYEQYVLAELLRSGDFERHLNRERRKLRKKPNKTGQ
ncbi:MAG: PLP-dependent aminotransferase family protein [Oscillospiraceae bacterium]|nr:PLP-dependent aminotransferase family protein [Oscillospiraceae bacterium]